MEKEIVLIGLPGLYQNWLMSAIDQCSTYKVNGCNFLYYGNNIEWRRKIELDHIPSNKYVINLYVDSKNFVWYLYNFLEKTDDIGIKVNHLIDDLFSKSPNTVAFDGLLTHFIDSYNIKKDTDANYIKNAIIEYFYFLLIDKDAKFKSITSKSYDGFINIEYDDFKDPKILSNKLLSIPIFNQDHFDKLYAELEKRNYEFIYRSENFVSKGDHFDLIELSHIGYLLTNEEPLDWFNELVREIKLKEFLDRKKVDV